jgi:hypothetical protein
MIPLVNHQAATRKAVVTRSASSWGTKGFVT